MISNVTRLAHKVDDRVYHFFCENDAPLGECHDALIKFKAIVVQRINEVAQQEAQKPNEQHTSS